MAKASNITQNTYTFTSLAQGTSYDIKVEVTGDNAGNTGAGYLAGKFGPQLLSKIAPRNPNHWITMGDIGSALWAIPAVKTGVIRFVGGVAGSIINNY